MSYSEPARPAARRTRSSILTGLVVVSATLAGVLIYQSLASSSSSATPDAHARTVPTTESRPASEIGRLRLAPPVDTSRGDHKDALGQDDGALPAGVTVFDDEYPGVVNLDPDLLGALRQAATDAADDGVEFFVNSGWRSPEYQNQLLYEAVSKYGSQAEAARWVATADTSAHVSGDAIDIGPPDSAAWLSKHGAQYGLCQIYGNEPWHHELRPDAIEDGCPPMYADPTHDPRMQQ